MTARDANIFVLPLIFVNESLLTSYANYAYEKRKKSLSWHQKSASAVALFMNYLTKRRKDFPDPVSCFRAFVDDLEFGTIDPETEEDPSGLYWSPKSIQNVNKIIRYITLFNEYNYRKAEQLAAETNTQVSAILLNKKKFADFSEQHINIAAWHHKYSNSFLPHTNNVNKTLVNTVYTVKSEYQTRNKTALYTFPKERIFDLLEAFRTRVKVGDFAQQHNLRDMLITILMHFGGLRLSEPFHLFVEDIMENPNHPGEALVKIYHPDSRREQLAKIGLRTRNDKRNQHSYYSGWKNRDINEVTTVKWFPVEAGRWFWDLWVLYLTRQRVEAPQDKTHPFAFTNRDGAPASYGNFQQAHKRAVERIGLIVAKGNGTTPHSHRHRYGSDVWETTKDPVILQKVLRHSSPSSQHVYLHPSDETIRSELYYSFTELKKSASKSTAIELLSDSLKNISTETLNRLPEYMVQAL
ncbi:gamma-mobile-trio recombinase GmtY [Vibrio parahaemolyticus]